MVGLSVDFLHCIDIALDDIISGCCRRASYHTAAGTWHPPAFSLPAFSTCGEVERTSQCNVATYGVIVTSVRVREEKCRGVNVERARLLFRSSSCVWTGESDVSVSCISTVALHFDSIRVVFRGLVWFVHLYSSSAHQRNVQRSSPVVAAPHCQLCYITGSRLIICISSVALQTRDSCVQLTEALHSTVPAFSILVK